ncbi:MAG: serine/threonine protein kinase, partial [Labilithrix sp.]|nr:serine/threonine protein kinase [Labilithrix sp.]
MEPIPKTIAIKDRDDPFVIEDVIGEGGMGKVYRARDPATGALLAVKVLGAVGDPTRFALESDILSKLEHPNIVGYRGHGLTKDGHPYLAMEWIDGDDLEKRLETENLTVEEAVRIGRAVTDALVAAHAAGVIHRDLKPSNVILTRETSAVKLVDFGIARAANVDGLTRTGQALGTPGYMSPEQARGHAVDARTDLFSLGCLLYRCLGGRRPFKGSDIMEFATSLALEDPPPLRALAPSVPPALESLVAQLLQKDPALRPESALHTRKALDRIASATDNTEIAPTLPIPRGVGPARAVVTPASASTSAEVSTRTAPGGRAEIESAPTLAATATATATGGAGAPGARAEIESAPTLAATATDAARGRATEGRDGA